ncbi:MAG: hypothetical protein AABX89_06725 [Candidatus Thermoplasmatota archaeon]
MRPRPFVSLLAILVVFGGCATPPSGAAGLYSVAILGPEGEPFWNGTVAVAASAATVLGALEAAAASGRFFLDIEQSSLGAYVRAIGPYAEELSSGMGWCFLVDAGDGYRDVRAAADARALQAGERVLWRYGSSADC